MGKKKGDSPSLPTVNSKIRRGPEARTSGVWAGAMFKDLPGKSGEEGLLREKRGEKEVDV